MKTKFDIGDLVVKKGTTKSPRKISRITDEPGRTEVLFYDGGGCKLEELHNEYKIFRPKPGAQPVQFKSVDKGVEVTLRPSARYFVTVNGVDIPITNGFFSEMDDLSECDGSMARYLFENDDLQNALVAAGLVFKNVRGSYGCTQLFHTLYDQIISEANKVWHHKPKMRWRPTKKNLAQLPEPVQKYIKSLEAKVVK